jgi:hypothetical protein
MNDDLVVKDLIKNEIRVRIDDDATQAPSALRLSSVRVLQEQEADSLQAGLNAPGGLRGALGDIVKNLGKLGDGRRSIA